MIHIIHTLLVFGQPMLPSELSSSTRVDAHNVTLLASHGGGRRKGPGPDHGDDPRGDDPNDEQHDGSLPANGEHLPGKQEQDKYYRGGVHLPE